MLVCAASASARGWRDLRIDASSDSLFDGSVQQMRDELPYHHALLFVLVLKDLKSRFTPAEYHHQLDGLAYKQIVRLASPNVTAEYLAHYSRVGQAGPGFSDNTGAAAPPFYDRPN